jgi:hypothetical protein
MGEKSSKTWWVQSGALMVANGSLSSRLFLRSWIFDLPRLLMLSAFCRYDPPRARKSLYATLSVLGYASPQSNSMRGRFFRFPLFCPPQASSGASLVSVWIGILPTLQGKETHPHEVHADHVGSSASGKFPTRFPLGRLLTSSFGHGRALPRHCPQMAQS